MAYDPGAIDSTLAAAVGDEPVLIAELRVAFVESLERALAVLEAADDDGWPAAAWKVRSLAASFGAVRLMAMATEAAALPGDRMILAKLRRAVARL